jgi:hypothetical protein
MTDARAYPHAVAEEEQVEGSGERSNGRVGCGAPGVVLVANRDDQGEATTAAGGRGACGRRSPWLNNHIIEAQTMSWWVAWITHAILPFSRSHTLFSHPSIPRVQIREGSNTSGVDLGTVFS